MKTANQCNRAINKEKYRWFALNRRRTEEQIDEDFENLLANPHLVALDFMEDDPEILLLQTPLIEIVHKGTYWRIGRFIIMISRRFEVRSWRVEYRLKNIDGLLDPGHNRELVHHPHISNLRDGGEFGPDVGYFCTYDRDTIEKPLREGRISVAYEMFLNILTVYPTGQPFVDVEYWPVAGHVDESKGVKHDA